MIQQSVHDLENGFSSDSVSSSARTAEKKTKWGAATLNVKDLAHRWTNLSVISALLAGVATALMSISLPDGMSPHLKHCASISLCVAFVSCLVAACLYMFFSTELVQQMSKSTNMQFDLRAVNGAHALTGIGFIALMVGEFVVATGEDLYAGILCGAICQVVLCGLGMWTWFRFNHQMSLTKQSELEQHAEAGSVYTRLREYYQHDKAGDFFLLDKDEFMQKFKDQGMMKQKLAEKAFDSWIDRRLEEMLNNDPDF